MPKPRKIDIIKAQATGEHIPTEKPVEEVPEIETLAKQQEILSEDNKPKFTVPLADNTTIELPNELTVADVLKRRTLEAIWACANFIGNLSKHYSASLFDAETALQNALLNPSVRAELEQLVARVTGTPVSKLEANLTQVGAKVIYYWMGAMVTQNSKSGEQQPPKDRK